MGALSMLMALRELEVCCMVPPLWSGIGPPFRDMSGERLTLKLPNLVSLRLEYLEEGRIILSCPSLIEARLKKTNPFCIEVHDNVLESLELQDCQGIRCVSPPPKGQLQSLKHLAVSGCSEEGQHLIESLAQMRQLQTLIYEDFPKACMPAEFPPGLCNIQLIPSDWCQDLQMV